MRLEVDKNPFVMMLYPRPNAGLVSRMRTRSSDITCGDTSVNSINFITNSMDMDIDNDTDIDAAIDFAIGIVRLQRVSLLLLLRLLLLPRMFILTLILSFVVLVEDTLS